MPDLNKLNVTDGKAEIFKFEDVVNLNMVPGYADLVKEIIEKEVF